MLLVYNLEQATGSRFLATWSCVLVLFSIDAERRWTSIIFEDFPGGGYVFGPDGTCLSSTSDWSEGLLYVELPIG